jgi:hypothetical protein
MGARNAAEIPDLTNAQNLAGAKAMTLRRVIALASLAASMSACTTRAESPAVDTPVNTSPEAGGAAHVNMIRLDTGKTQPAPQPSQRVRKDTGVVLRDSASGPRMEIDATGKTRPIKK